MPAGERVPARHRRGNFYAATVDLTIFNFLGTPVDQSTLFAARRRSSLTRFRWRARREQQEFRDECAAVSLLQVYRALTATTAAIPGATVENNKFCLSVHFRCVVEEVRSKSNRPSTR